MRFTSTTSPFANIFHTCDDAGVSDRGSVSQARAGRAVGGRVDGRALLVVVVLIVAAWAVLLRPPSLGGSTSYVLVSDSTMAPAVYNHDLVLVQTHDAYRVGDVVAYRIPEGQASAGSRVLRRIVGGSATAGYDVRADAAAAVDAFHPRAVDLLGSKAFRVPLVGRPVSWLHEPALWIGAGAVAALSVLWATRTRRTVAAPRVIDLTGSSAVRAHIVETIRTRYLAESDAAAKRAVRHVAYEIAMAYSGEDPHFGLIANEGVVVV